MIITEGSAASSRQLTHFKELNAVLAHKITKYKDLCANYLTKFENEKNKLKIHLMEFEEVKVQYRDECIHYQNRIVVLEDENKDLHRKCLSYEAELQKLKLEQKTLDEVQDEIILLKKQNEIKEKQNKDYRLKINSLKKEMENLKKQVSQFKKASGDSANLVKNLENEKLELSKSLEQATSLIKKLEAEGATSEPPTFQQSDLISKLQEENESLRIECKKLKENTQKLHDNYSNIVSSLEEAEKIKTQFQCKHTELENEHNVLKPQISELQLKNKKLTEDIESYKQNISHLQDQISSDSTTILNANSEISNLEVKLKELRESLEIANSQIVDVKKEKKQLQDILDEKKESIRQLETEIEALRAANIASTESIQKFKESNALLEEKSSSFETQHSQLQYILDEAKSTIIRLQNQIQDLEKESQVNLSSLIEANSTLEKELLESKEQISKLLEEKAALQLSLDNVKESLSQIQKRSNELEINYATLHKLQSATEAANQSLINENQSLQAKLENLTKVMQMPQTMESAPITKSEINEDENSLLIEIQQLQNKKKAIKKEISKLSKLASKLHDSSIGNIELQNNDIFTEEFEFVLLREKALALELSRKNTELLDATDEIIHLTERNLALEEELLQFKQDSTYDKQQEISAIHETLSLQVQGLIFELSMKNYALEENKHELLTSHEHILELEQVIDSMNHKISFMEEMQQKFEKEYRSIKKKNISLHSCVNRLESENLQVQNSLQKVIKKLQNNVEHLSKFASNNVSDLNSIELLDLIQENIDSLIKDQFVDKPLIQATEPSTTLYNEEVMKNNRNLQIEQQNLNTKLQKQITLARTLTEENEALRTEIAQKNSIIETLTQSLDSSKKVIEELENRVAMVKSLRNAVKMEKEVLAKETINRIDSDQQNSSANIEGLNETIKKLDKHLEDEREKNIYISEELTQSIKLTSSLNSKLDTLQSEIVEKDNKIKALNDKTRELSEKLVDNDSQLELLKKDIVLLSNIEGKYNALSTNYQTLIDRESDFQAKIVELEQAVAETSNQLSLTQTALQDSEEKSASLENDVKQSFEYSHSLESENSELHAKISQKDSDIEALTEILTSSKHVFNDFEHRIATVKNLREAVKKEREDKNKELENTLAEQTSIISEKDNTLSQLMEENANLRNDLCTKDAIISNATSLKANLESQLNNLMEKNKEMESELLSKSEILNDYETYISDLKVEVTNSVSKILELESQLDEQFKISSELEDKLSYQLTVSSEKENEIESLKSQLLSSKESMEHYATLVQEVKGLRKTVKEERELATLDSTSKNEQLNFHLQQVSAERDELDEKITSLIQTLKQKEDDITHLSLENERLIGNINRVEKELQATKEQLSEVTIEEMQLLNESNQKSSTISEQQVQISELQQKNNTLTNSLNQLEKFDSTLKEELSIKQSELDKLHFELNQVSAEKDNFSIKLMNTNKLNEKLQEELNQHVKKISELEKEYRESMEYSMSLENEVKRSMDSSLVLQNEISELRSEIIMKDSKICELSETFSSSENLFNTLENRIAAVKNLREVVKKERETQSSKISEELAFERNNSSLLSMSVDKLKQDIEVLTANINEKEYENQLLTEQTEASIAELKKQLDREKDENSKLSTTLQSKIAEMKFLNNELNQKTSKFNESLSTRDIEIAKLTTSLKDMNSFVEDVHMRVNDINIIREGMKGETKENNTKLDNHGTNKAHIFSQLLHSLSEIKSDYAMLLDKLQMMEKASNSEVGALVEKCNSLQESISSQTCKLEELKMTNISYIKELETKSQEISSLITDARAKDINIEQLESNVLQMTNRIADLESKDHASQEEIEYLQATLAEHKKQLSMKSCDLDVISKKLSKTVEEKEQLHSSISNEKDELHRLLTVKNDEIKKHLSTIDEQKNSVLALSNELDQLRISTSERDTTFTELSAKNESLEQEKFTLNSNLKEKVDNIIDLQNIISENTTVIQSLEDKIKRLTSENISLQNEILAHASTINEISQRLSTEKEELSKVQTILTQKNAEISKYQSQNSELEDANSKMNEKVYELEKEIKEIIASHDSMLGSLKNTINTLNEQAHEYENILAERDATITNLNNSNADLKETIIKHLEEIESFKQLLQEYQAKISSKEELIEEIQAQLVSQEGENNILSQNVHDLNLLIVELTNELKCMIKNEDEKAQEYRILSRNTNSEPQEIRDLVSAILDLKKTLDDWRLKFLKIQTLHNELKNEKDTLSAKLSQDEQTYQEHLASLTSLLEDRDNTIYASKEKIDDLKSKLQLKSNLLEDKILESRKLQEEIDTLTEENKSLIVSLHTSKQIMEQWKHKIQLVKSLRNDVKNAQKVKSDEFESIAKSRDELMNTNFDLNTIIEENKELVLSLRAEVENLNEKNETIQSSLEEQMGTNANLQRIIKFLRDSLHSMDHQLSESKDSNEQMDDETMVQSSIDKITSLQTLVTTLQNDLQEKITALEVSDRNMREINKNLENQKMEVHSKLIEIEKLESNVISLQEEVQNLKSHLNEITQQYDISKHAAIQNQNKIQELQDLLQHCQEEREIAVGEASNWKSVVDKLKEKQSCDSDLLSSLEELNKKNQQKIDDLGIKLESQAAEFEAALNEKELEIQRIDATMKKEVAISEVKQEELKKCISQLTDEKKISDQLRQYVRLLQEKIDEMKKTDNAQGTSWKAGFHEREKAFIQLLQSQRDSLKNVISKKDIEISELKEKIALLMRQSAKNNSSKSKISDTGLENKGSIQEMEDLRSLYEDQIITLRNEILALKTSFSEALEGKNSETLLELRHMLSVSSTIDELQLKLQEKDRIIQHLNQKSHTDKTEQSPSPESISPKITVKEALHAVVHETSLRPQNISMIKESHVEQTVDEILNSERSYVTNLKILYDILNNEEFKDSAQNLSMLQNDINTILITNQKFLDDLEGCWKKSETVSQRVHQVSDLLIKYAPFFKTYINYIQNFDIYQEIINDLKKVKRAYLKEKKSELQKIGHRMTDISSFLVLPIQRIPRYNLLLTNLIKHAESIQDKNRLQEAQKVIDQITKLCNERKGMFNNSQIWIDLAWRLQMQEKLIEPHRKLLLPAYNLKRIISVAGKKTIHVPCHLFICNDMLLLVPLVRKKEEGYRIEVIPCGNGNISVHGHQHDNRLEFQFQKPNHPEKSYIDLKCETGDNYQKIIKVLPEQIQRR